MAQFYGAKTTGIKEQLKGIVGLIADGVHSQTYSLAFDIAGIEHELIDSKELAFAGLSGAAREIWGHDES